MAIVSALGIADASYLTVHFFTKDPLKCGGIFPGCDAVTGSIYSHIGPVPVALLGMGYYLSVFLLALLYLDKKDHRVLTLLAIAPWAGLLASIYFVALQLAVIHAICMYCMFSAFTSTVIFILSLFLCERAKNKKIPVDSI